MPYFTSIFTDYKRKNYKKKKKEKAATDQLYKSQNSAVVGALQPVAVSVRLSVCPFCLAFTCGEPLGRSDMCESHHMGINKK